MKPDARDGIPGETLTVLAPAKINLGLEVLARRPDGWHEIVTIYQSLRLWDRLRLRLETEPGIRLRVTPPGLDLGPAEENLAVRAAKLLLPEDAPAPGLAIHLHKRVPVGAGLGGGSSDGAAVLLGLNRLLSRELDEQALLEKASGLGSDVAFFLRGGTQLGEGRGERLTALPPFPSRWLVLVFPNIALSTSSIYARAKLHLTVPGPLASMAPRKISEEFWQKEWQSLRNDLQSIVEECEPGVAAILEELRGLGASFARLTGSGSCVFADAPDSRTAAAWEDRFRRGGHWARSVRPSRRGCWIRETVRPRSIGR